ncbi:MAG: MFS transporter [Candidatus Nanopelagicales bacterium]|nr:MFS transporter [Candidatus Nanopelagicales bacterium]
MTNERKAEPVSSPSQQARTASGSWFVVIAFALAAAATQMLWLTFAPVTTLAADHYGVDVDTIGFLSIIFPLLYVLLAIPWGLLLDRWFRPALAIGASLTAVGGVVRTVDTESFALALAGQIICAAAQPLVLNSVAKLAVDYLPRSQRPTGIAVGTVGLFVGMLTSFVLGAVFSSNLGQLLQVQAVIAVVAAVCMAVALTRPARFADDTDTGIGRAGATSGSAVGAAAAHPLRTSWSDPVIRLLVGLITVGNGVFVALTTWLQPFLADAGVSSNIADVMLLVLVVFGIAGAAIVPPIAARRRTQTRWMLSAIVIGALGCVALAVAPAVVTGFVVSALIGFLVLAVLPIVLDLVERRAGPAAATATGLVWLAGNAGGVVISLAVGALVSLPALGFLVLSVIMIGAGLPVVRALHRRIGSHAAVLPDE